MKNYTDIISAYEEEKNKEPGVGTPEYWAQVQKKLIADKEKKLREAGTRRVFLPERNTLNLVPVAAIDSIANTITPDSSEKDVIVNRLQYNPATFEETYHKDMLNLIKTNKIQRLLGHKDDLVDGDDIEVSAEDLKNFVTKDKFVGPVGLNINGKKIIVDTLRSNNPYNTLSIGLHELQHSRQSSLKKYWDNLFYNYNDRPIEKEARAAASKLDNGIFKVIQEANNFKDYVAPTGQKQSEKEKENDKYDLLKEKIYEYAKLNKLRNYW